jgi:Sulfotransferase domain
MQRIFHIGIPKSGTTTIQETLQNDERIVLTRSRFLTSSDWWINKPETYKDGELVVESNETLISGGFNKVKFIQVVERMYNVDKNAKIIITIRQQQSAVLSMFKYHIKNNYEGSKNLFNWLYNSTLGIDYLSICMYGNISKTLLSYFPKENISFLFYEELKENPKAFYNKFYKVLGIEFNESFVSKRPLNIMNLDNSQIYTLSLFNRFSFTKKRFNRFNKHKRIRRLEQIVKRKIVNLYSLNAKENFFELSKLKGFCKLENEFKANNRSLVESGFVSKNQLKKYNYLY